MQRRALTLDRDPVHRRAITHPHAQRQRGIEQHLRQRRPAHAARFVFVIGDVDQGPVAVAGAEQARHWHAGRVKGRTHAQRIEGGHALRLDQQAGAERTEGSMLLEDRHAMTETGQGNGARQAGRAGANDSDGDRIASWHHLAILDEPRPAGSKLQCLFLPYITFMLSE